jgi:hypothetical protein
MVSILGTLSFVRVFCIACRHIYLLIEAIEKKEERGKVVFPVGFFFFFFEIGSGAYPLGPRAQGGGFDSESRLFFIPGANPGNGTRNRHNRTRILPIELLAYNYLSVNTMYLLYII